VDEYSPLFLVALKRQKVQNESTDDDDEDDDDDD
jgi:hypothetical protein